MAIDLYTLFNAWETAGVFDLVLPFLLIFALIYGILLKSRILGDNKGISVLIAVVIGFLALRTGYVQNFFIEVFPRLGVGLAALLVLLVLAGLFIGDLDAKHKNTVYWILIGIGVIITIVVLGGSFADYGWGSDWTSENLIVWIISIALLIGVIIAVVTSSSKKDGETGKKD